MLLLDYSAFEETAKEIARLADATEDFRTPEIQEATILVSPIPKIRIQTATNREAVGEMKTVDQRTLPRVTDETANRRTVLTIREIQKAKIPVFQTMEIRKVKHLVLERLSKVWFQAFSVN